MEYQQEPRPTKDQPINIIWSIKLIRPNIRASIPKLNKRKEKRANRLGKKVPWEFYREEEEEEDKERERERDKPTTSDDMFLRKKCLTLVRAER